MSGGSKGGGGSSTNTTYSSNLPEYAKPFYEELLKQSGKQIYQTDASGNVTGVKPFVGYTGERLAGFTPEQIAAQTEIAGMTTPGEFTTAQGTLGTVGAQAGTAATKGLAGAFGYTPGTFTPATISTGTFDAAAAKAYMDPYTQSVIDIEKREAQRQADIQKAGSSMGAIGRGTFGGGRQGIAQAELERARLSQIGQAQAQGFQTALGAAQQQQNLVSGTQLAAGQALGRMGQQQQAMSLADIQAEFGGSGPISLSEYYRGGSYVGSSKTAVPNTGTIDLADFYSQTAYQIITQTGNRTHNNLTAHATAYGWDGVSKIDYRINSNVYTYSTSTGSAAITINKADSIIRNYGKIMGQGGNGGQSAATGYAAAAAGGPAIKVSASGCQLINYAGAYIGGGGGGYNLV